MVKVRKFADGITQHRQCHLISSYLQLYSLDDRLIALCRQKAVAQADLAVYMGAPKTLGIEPNEELNVAGVPQ